MFTNDTAERDVKFIEKYNSSLTRDEEQKQYLPITNCQRLQKKYHDCNIEVIFFNEYYLKIVKYIL